MNRVRNVGVAGIVLPTEEAGSSIICESVHLSFVAVVAVAGIAASIYGIDVRFPVFWREQGLQTPKLAEVNYLWAGESSVLSLRLDIVRFRLETWVKNSWALLGDRRACAQVN